MWPEDRTSVAAESWRTLLSDLSNIYSKCFMRLLNVFFKLFFLSRLVNKPRGSETEVLGFVFVLHLIVWEQPYLFHSAAVSFFPPVEARGEEGTAAAELFFFFLEWKTSPIGRNPEKLPESWCCSKEPEQKRWKLRLYVNFSCCRKQWRLNMEKTIVLDQVLLPSD